MIIKINPPFSLVTNLIFRLFRFCYFPLVCIKPSEIEDRDFLSALSPRAVIVRFDVVCARESQKEFVTHEGLLIKQE